MKDNHFCIYLLKDSELLMESNKKYIFTQAINQVLKNDLRFQRYDTLTKNNCTIFTGNLNLIFLNIIFEAVFEQLLLNKML